MTRKITITLDPSSIKDAIKQLDDYKAWVERKTALLVERIGQEVAAESRSGFASALVDDLLKGGGHSADVTVTTEDRGNITVVIASGEDAVWAEFGSGVYHNTPAGTSPHPNGAELGFTIGSYGKGMGTREVWGFYKDGELKLTHGTSAQMPMYRAVKAVCDRIGVIAAEIFGGG